MRGNLINIKPCDMWTLDTSLLEDFDEFEVVFLVFKDEDV